MPKKYEKRHFSIKTDFLRAYFLRLCDKNLSQSYTMSKIHINRSEKWLSLKFDFLK